jgi:hypothetical protein
MNDLNRKRTVRVFFGREVKTIAALELALGLVLIALILADQWLIRLFMGISLTAIAVALGYRLVKLYNNGLEIAIESDEESPESQEPPAEETTPLTEQLEDEPVDESVKEPHWTEVAYPDPDEELFGQQKTSEQESSEPIEADSAHWSEKAYPDPDDKAKA